MMQCGTCRTRRPGALTAAWNEAAGFEAQNGRPHASTTAGTATQTASVSPEGQGHAAPAPAVGVGAGHVLLQGLLAAPGGYGGGGSDWGSSKFRSGARNLVIAVAFHRSMLLWLLTKMLHSQHRAATHLGEAPLVCLPAEATRPT
jgi:hypothetical protein